MSAPLAQEAARVAALKETLVRVYGNDLVDEDDFLTAIESETEFTGMARRVVQEIMHREALAAAIEDQEKQLAERRKRCEVAEERLRSILREAMEAAGLKKLPLPEATLSLSHRGSTVNITDEAAIPAGFKREKVTVTVDKGALKEALSFAPVPGAVLSNAPPSLTIRRT